MHPILEAVASQMEGVDLFDKVSILSESSIEQVEWHLDSSSIHNIVHFCVKNNE